MNPVSTMLTPWAILTATAGLIAFHIGLFTLIGRERKSPYIINSVFPILLLCLVVAGLAVIAVLVPAPIQDILLKGTVACLAFAFILSGLSVYRIAVRFTYFVDSVSLIHLPIIRWLRRRKTIRSPRPNYSHNAIPIPQCVKEPIVQFLAHFQAGSFDCRDDLDFYTLAAAVEHQGQSNKLLAELARVFLVNNLSIQYLTASRHPIEFIVYLKHYLEKNGLTWADFTSHIVAIDAYSPHFAFTDSIYAKNDLALESLDVSCVRSKMTFAGMHSASSRAFNVLKERSSQGPRKPTLVIYEDAYALCDLESPEQYRIFVRHVMPSERLWGGMFTIFLESALPEGDWNVLQASASMRLNLRYGAGHENRTALQPTKIVLKGESETKLITTDSTIIK